MGKQATNRYKMLQVDKIDPPKDASRMTIDIKELEELARSIEEQGLLEPIIVNDGGERFEIVAGDRRHKAVMLLGHKTINARIVEMDREEIDLARAVENMQRKDLSPFEEGVIYCNLNKVHKMALEDISRRMGKSMGVIKRRMEIMKMPESIQRALHAREVRISVAEELMSCSDKAHQDYLLEMAIEHGVTRDVTRMWVSDWRKSLREPPGASGGGALDAHLMKPEIIYRGCETCQAPVNIHEMKELRICKGCFKAIIEGIQAE